MKILHCLVWVLLVFGAVYGCYVAKLCFKETKAILKEERSNNEQNNHILWKQHWKNQFRTLIILKSKKRKIKIMKNMKFKKVEYIRIDNDKICYLMRGDK